MPTANVRTPLVIRHPPEADPESIIGVTMLGSILAVSAVIPSLLLVLYFHRRSPPS
jgi:hypothetical protein